MTGDALGRLRRLPWSSPDGRPCYAPDGGQLSELADQLEAGQLCMGHAVLDLAREVLTDSGEPSAETLFFLVQQLRTSLTTALSVADSRGARLGVPEAVAGGLLLAIAARRTGDDPDTHHGTV